MTGLAIDLWAALGGGTESRVGSARVRAVALCTCSCGKNVGEIFLDAALQEWLRVSAIQLTREQTRGALIQAALDDFEALVAEPSKFCDVAERTRDLMAFATLMQRDGVMRSLPPLIIPGRRLPLESFRDQWLGEQNRAELAGTVPRSFSEFRAGCTKCRRRNYFGASIAEWLAHRGASVQPG